MGMRALLLAFVSCTLLVLSTGCEDLTRPPFVPEAETGEPEPPPLPDEDDFPPVPESSVAYDRASPHSYGALSRYVLDTTDVSEFELQYLDSDGLFAYTGTYRSTLQDSVTSFRSEIVFDFDGGYFTGTAPDATGILMGNRLEVTYHPVMVLSDFESGTYVRR